jgi:bacterioferritin-associated ferredoxin
MIVCSCNTIDHRQIETAVDTIVVDDPYRLITPVLVYKRLGKRPQCGGCLSLATTMIHNRVECLRNCGACPLAQAVQITQTRVAPAGNDV